MYIRCSVKAFTELLPSNVGGEGAHRQQSDLISLLLFCHFNYTLWKEAALVCCELLSPTCFEGTRNTPAETRTLYLPNRGVRSEISPLRSVPRVVLTHKMRTESSDPSEVQQLKKNDTRNLTPAEKLKWFCVVGHSTKLSSCSYIASTEVFACGD
jgi:hypothetical protein